MQTKKNALISVVFLLPTFLGFSCNSCDEDSGVVTPPANSVYSNVIISSDGGQSWNSIAINNMASLETAVSVGEGVFLVAGKHGNERAPAVHVSTDFGYTWRRSYYFQSGKLTFGSPILRSKAYGSAVFLSGLENSFSNDFRGRQFYHSTNSGFTWPQTTTDTVQGDDMDFANVTTGVVVGGGGIYRTTNSGFNWIKILNQNLAYSKISFSGNYGIIVRDLNNAIYYLTSDAGNSWGEYQFPVIEAHCKGVGYFYPRYGIIATRSHGEYLRSVDGGLTWSGNRIEGASDLEKVASDLSGNVLINSFNSIYRSTNNGSNFSLIYNHTIGKILTGVFYDYISGRIIAIDRNPGY